MNFLKKVFGFNTKDSKPFTYIHDFVIQVCISTLFLSIIGIAILYVLEPHAFLIIIESIFIIFVVLWLYSFFKGMKILYTVCTSLTFLYSLMLISIPVITMISLCHIEFSVEDLQRLFYYCLFFVILSLFPTCNVFFWHFRKKYTSTDSYLLRTFVILNTSFYISLLLSVWCAYNSSTSSTSTVILIFPVLFGCISVFYVLYRILREKKNLFETDMPGKLPQKREIKSANFFIVYYVVYVVCTAVVALMASAKVASGVGYVVFLWNPNPVYANTYLAIYGVSLVFFLLWSTSIIANPNGVLTKICTILSIIAIVLTCIFMSNFIVKGYFALIKIITGIIS